MNERKDLNGPRRWFGAWLLVPLACVLTVFAGLPTRSASADDERTGRSLIPAEITSGAEGTSVPRLTKGEVRYKIKVPVNENGTAPASPVTAVTVFPGGADPTKLTPVVRGPSGTRRGAELLWARTDEPIRVLFDTSNSFESDSRSADHAVFYLSLLRADRVEEGPDWTRRHGLTLETKNFGPSVAEPFDDSRLEAFIKRWNKSPETDGRSLVKRVQHGYPLHRPYGKTPLEYMPNRGAPLSLHRYRGYFRVDKPDRSKIAPLKKKVKTRRKKVKSIEEKLEKLKKKVKDAKKALKKARKNENRKTVKNRKTALNEWRYRRDKVAKRKLPIARRKLEFAEGAISELKNNTYTFLTGSAGASWVLVDGTPVASWPATKQLPKKGDKYYNYNEGAVNLEPGIHRVEYLYAATGKTYLTFMLWRHPAQKKPRIMETERFGNVAEADVLKATRGGAGRPPAWELTKDSRIPGVPDFVLAEFHVPHAPKTNENENGPVYRWTFGDGATARGRTVEHLYLATGTYEVTLEAYETASEENRLWSVTQPVRVHVPYDLEAFIETDRLRTLIREKTLDVYPVRHLLHALQAVEKLDPDRLSYGPWRRRVLRALAERPDAFARASVDWTARAGEMCLSPTVALYEEAFRFFGAATGMMDPRSLRWHRTKLREVRAHLLVRGAGTDALDLLGTVQPNRHDAAPGMRAAWWGFGPGVKRAGTIPDLTGDAPDGELVGKEGATVVEEETRHALELDGGKTSVRLRVPPRSVLDSDGDGTERVTLDVSGSGDRDGSVNSYRWTKNGAKLATGPTAEVPLDVGSHEITLTVTDNDGKTDTDTIDVTVENAEVLHYDFDQGTGSTARDRSGQGHDGTLAGPAWSTSTPDASSGSLSMDGNDDLAINGYHYSSGGHPEVTVTAWVKTRDGTNQVLVSYDRSEYWRLEINGSGAGHGQVGWDLNTDAGQLDFGGTTRIDDGTWHHVAAVYDHGTTRLYIDGEQDGRTSKGSTFGSGATRYGFVGVGSEAGRFNGNRGPNAYLNGTIDDVRIYETALSAARIRDLASLQHNHPPDADHDRATVDGTSSVSVDVLANDIHPDGHTLSLTDVTDPSAGTAAINDDGTITYTPNDSFEGVDRFQYTVRDGSGGRDTATVSVATPDAPTAEAGLKQAGHASFTVSLRVKFMEQPEGEAVLLRDNAFELRLDGGVPVFEGRREAFTARAEDPLEPGHWYSLVLSRAPGEKLALYVDGREVLSEKIGDSDSYLQELHVGEGDIRLRITDVRVYRGVLSRLERLALTVDRTWLRTRAEALLGAGRVEEAGTVVETWSDVTERIITADPVRRSATMRRIKSLVERGTDQALLAARDEINGLLKKAPRRLFSGAFNITMLDMYLGRGANRVAVNHADRLLRLPLSSGHEEKIMARRIIALARLGKMETARDAFETLEEKYPYGEALRRAREALENQK